MAQLARAAPGVSGALPGAAASATAAAALALGLRRPEVTPLEGGVANRSYRLREGKHDFVVRIVGAAAPGLGASSRSELAMQALAAAAGLAPPIVLVDTARGFVVSEFAAGRAPSADEMREPAAAAAGRRLVCKPACARQRLRDLRRSTLGSAPRPISHGSRCTTATGRSGILGASCRVAARRLRHRPAWCLATTTCTGATCSTTARRILAIDWEYAGPGDPAADLAAFAGYQALVGPAIDALIAGYGGTNAGLRDRVSALAWIFDCLWYGWNAAAAEDGLEPDPGEQSRLAARLLA